MSNISKHDARIFTQALFANREVRKIPTGVRSTHKAATQFAGRVSFGDDPMLTMNRVGRLEMKLER